MGASCNLESLLGPLYLKRSMGANHRAQLLAHLRKFAGETEDHPRAFCDTTVNAWIADHVRTSGASLKTQKAYRANVLNAWRTAYLGGLVSLPPGIIAPITLPVAPPRAWNLDELRRLRQSCADIVEGAWAAALIELTWSTGLRRCDAYAFSTKQMDSTGVYRLVQQKTCHAHACYVSADARRAMDEVGGRLEPLGREKASRIFRELRAAAGLEIGTARWLRRSAASYVERERPGQGVAFLGHKAQGVAARHYFDPAITASFVRGPSPRLGFASSTPIRSR
ncbi:hypothetical protein K2D_12990 [Planctomycetes bacterium K2D]|nr:hypothetical protein K2D_12990 [Planctomycetes bacterium K2D]